VPGWSNWGFRKGFIGGGGGGCVLADYSCGGEPEALGKGSLEKKVSLLGCGIITILLKEGYLILSSGGGRLGVVGGAGSVPKEASLATIFR